MGARADADVGCVGFLYWVASMGSYSRQGKYIIAGLRMFNQAKHHVRLAKINPTEQL